MRRRGLRLAAGSVGLAAAGAMILGVGGAGSAQAAKADKHGCVVTSNGFTYDCESGMLAWDSTVTIAAPYDTAVLYDASTTPQKRVAGPVSLPEGPGPDSAFLGTFKCGDFQFDIATPGKVFVAGHKGSNGPCTTPTPTPSTPTPSTPTPSTTTTTKPPATTPPKPSSTETSAVLAAEATYSVAPVNAGAEDSASVQDSGFSLTPAQALFVLAALVALWIAAGAPRPRIDRSGRFQA